MPPATATPTLRTSRRIRAVALMLAAIAASVAGASAIYRSVDPRGHVTFSDIAPEPGARALTLAPGNRFRPRVPPPLPQTGAPDAVGPDPHVEIVSPPHDAAVRSNNGALTVVGHSSAALKPGHVAELSLDGTVIGRGQRLTFDLTNLDRGTHELMLRVVDAEGRVVATSRPTVFHLLRARRFSAP